MPEAPQGTVTFLFTDIVGSTRLWEKFPHAMGPALARHDGIMRSAMEAWNGSVFKTVGDAFCVAFSTPTEALSAAIEAQRGLAAESWDEIGPLLVRMGLHSGTAEYREGDYFGGTLNRTSRIESAAHGGQILLSQITYELLEDERREGIRYQSLGSYRLRNLDRPEHLYQATATGLKIDFPPPRSMEVLPNNLPVQATSFVGREKEIAESLRRLEKTRLLTLMGTGGTGKTRLSLEIGARVIHEFPDGVWLAELALITDPDLVVAAVASAVGAREESDRPLRETLVHFLKSKSVLLVLDNCEHVLTAASSLVGDLLRACPRLKVLAASRHSLGIAGETTFPVPPMGMYDVRLQALTGPDLVDQLSQYEAVRLFIDRATSVRPDFVVTNANAPALAEICSRLDGIPLAIELAAARVRVLDLDQIAGRLGDRFRLLRSKEGGGHLPHQQTLQTLIDWSFDLLSEPERRLFRRLAVFVGGRTIEALEAVCADEEIEEMEVLELLEQLIDKSLVTVERENGSSPRYTLIESVWQYSRDKLTESGEENTLRDRHLNYFLRFAEKAAPHLEGRDQKEWLDRCQGERFNFRSAFQWAQLSRQAESGCRLFAATYRAIEIRGSLEEAREVVGHLLELPLDGVPQERLAHFYLAAGRIAWAADRYEDCRNFHNKAHTLYLELEDGNGIALCEMLKGFLDRGIGALDEAEAHFRRGMEIVADSPDSDYVRAGCLSGLGSVALDRGDPETARRLKEDSLQVYERIGDRWIIGLILWGISDVCIAQGDHDRARSALAEWTAITRDLGNRWMLPHILEGEASLAAAAANPLRAARLLGAAEVARDHFGTQFSPAETARHENTLTTVKGLVAEKDLQHAWEEGRVASPWDLIRTA